MPAFDILHSTFPVVIAVLCRQAEDETYHRKALLYMSGTNQLYMELEN